MSLRDVNLGYAGRYPGQHPVHRWIAALTVGDELLLGRDKDRWEVRNARGQTVGRLARSFRPPADTRFISGKVAAVLVWKRGDSKLEYATRLQCDQWEVIVPELLFGPSP